MSGQVVGDVGGSSSRWAWWEDGGEPIMLETLPGSNPAVGDPQQLTDALKASMAERQALRSADRIHVYGAGCGSSERKARMRTALSAVWPSARIEVESDLLGAARGMLANDPGLVLILGTGMNAGYYDGQVLHLPMPSLGYILGDEGSGADLGKHLLIEALRGQLPTELYTALFPGGIDMDTVVSHLYRGSGPQKWLASFAEPLAKQGDHPVARRIIAGRFERMVAVIGAYFGPAERTRAVAVGSVAAGLRPLLSEVLSAAGTNLSAVQRSPLEGLVRYHREAAR